MLLAPVVRRTVRRPHQRRRDPVVRRWVCHIAWRSSNGGGAAHLCPTARRPASTRSSPTSPASSSACRAAAQATWRCCCGDAAATMSRRGRSQPASRTDSAISSTRPRGYSAAATRADLDDDELPRPSHRVPERAMGRCRSHARPARPPLHRHQRRCPVADRHRRSPQLLTTLPPTSGAPGRTRTCDLEIRRLLLYPAELRGRVRLSEPPAPSVAVRPERRARA